MMAVGKTQRNRLVANGFDRLLNPPPRTEKEVRCLNQCSYHARDHDAALFLPLLEPYFGERCRARSVYLFDAVKR
jgi:hypothetical protein